jgi:hypothetical protein
MPRTRRQFVTVKSLIWPWGHSSRSKVIINGTRHIVWRWFTYMPNMKSLSWMTKKLQPGHDLLLMHEPVWPWGQMSPTMVCDTSSGGRLPTCQICKACLERQKFTARTRFVTDGRTDKLITIGRLPLCGGALMKYTTSYLDLHSEFTMRAD